MTGKRKIFTILFSVTLVIIAALFVLSVVKTDRFSSVVHQDTYTGTDLFRVDDDRDKDLSVRAETRIYRKKLTKEEIIGELEKNKGTQFDPEIADIFLKIIKSGRADI